jgi:hypothetical protein
MWLAFMSEPRVFLAIAFWLLVFFLRKQNWFWVLLKETIPNWLRSTIPNWLRVALEYLMSPLIKTGILAAATVDGTQRLQKSLGQFSIGGVITATQAEAIEAIAVLVTFLVVGLFSYHLYGKLEALYYRAKAFSEETRETIRQKIEAGKWELQVAEQKARKQEEVTRRREEREERKDLDRVLGSRNLRCS